MICDYHLYKIPSLITWDCKKVFLWFIPILSEEHYTPETKDIVWSLSHCDEIYFFNEVWAHNFKKAFRYYFPESALKTKVRAVMMGPDEDYALSADVTAESYTELLHSKLQIETNLNKKFLLSVSRMDFVKNIPLSIKGFEKYLTDNPNDTSLELVLIAPHHRKDSDIYIAEAGRIKNLVETSIFSHRIHLTHDYFNAEELRILFSYADAFVCPSTFDAVPLTPLEYVLANKSNGGVILSDSIGAYQLVFPNCYEFEHENVNSLSMAIKQCVEANPEDNKERMDAMKSVIIEESVQQSMLKIKYHLENL